MKLLFIILLFSLTANAQTTGTIRSGDSLTVTVGRAIFKKFHYTEDVSDRTTDLSAYGFLTHTLIADTTIKDTVFIKNVNEYQEGKVNVLVSPSGRKSVVTIEEGEWRSDSELHDYGINTLMTTKFGLVQVGKIYYMHIIFGKPRKDYLIPTSKIQATKFSKECSLQIGKWEKVPENFTVL